MIDQLSAILKEYSARCNFASKEKNCFDYRKELKDIVLSAFPDIKIDAYNLVPHEATTFRYYDGRIFLKHAVIGVQTGSGILIMDPFLHRSDLQLQPYSDYVSVACADQQDAYLEPDSF